MLAYVEEMAMTYNIVPLELTPMELEGLSEKLIASHYENNYGGAVRRLNAITAELARLDPATAPNFALNGLKREELVATNSMILHEIYFAGLGGPGRQGKPASTPLPALARALEKDFGSVARWQAEFSSMGKALGGGSGWVLLVWSPRDGKLRNQWAGDHTQALADGRVVLALDMYEHAYHMDYGARVGGYVDAVMRNIHWEWAEQRFLHVTAGGPLPEAHYGKGALAPESLRAELAGGAAPLLLDVRRRKAYDASPDMLPGAEYREPEKVSEWAAALPRGREIVVYCVYGHNVSEDTAASLVAAGHKVRPLAGGIAAWRAIGGPTQPRKG
jgi:superoxide dismutase, Fe-Mn family